MARTPIPSFAYVLVVVEERSRYLIVQERKHGAGFYLPAGGIEVGETIVGAAVRETLEEAGVLVEPVALLGIDQQWIPGAGRIAVRWRFVLSARCVGDPTPKSEPDSHTLGARWVDLAALRRLPLRHPEVIGWIDRHRGGAAQLPLSSVGGAGLTQLALVD